MRDSVPGLSSGSVEAVGTRPWPATGRGMKRLFPQRPSNLQFLREASHPSKRAPCVTISAVDRIALTGPACYPLQEQTEENRMSVVPRATMIYTHVLNHGPAGPRGPVDSL